MSQAQYIPITQSQCSPSEQNVTFFLPFMPRPPGGYGVTSLFSRLMQPSQDVLVFLLRMSPQTSLSLKQVPTLPQCPVVIWGKVLISSPVLFISTQIMASCCYAIIWSAGKHKLNCLLPVFQEKHDALQLTCGSYGQPLDVGNCGCSMCLATMGPTLGAKFLSWVFSPFM